MSVSENRRFRHRISLSETPALRYRLDWLIPTYMTCAISISKPAPHIIEITSNNGWIGYAYYIQQKDMYQGAMEWKAGQGGAYENDVFLLELTYDGNTLTKRAHGTKRDFSTTYRMK